MSFDRKLFGDKVRRYREQLGVSIAELARDTGIESARLTALEDGQAEPTGDEVLILADHFMCDYRFFVSNERTAPFEQTETLFRRYGSALSKEDRWSIQEFLFLCESEQFVLEELRRLPTETFSYTKSGDYYKGHGEGAALEVRRFLGYKSSEASANVYRDLRRLGFHVFRRRLSNSHISGLFIRHPTAGPCVLVNYTEDVSRQQFTAAHEAGHGILDDGTDGIISFTEWAKNDLVEIRANTFASRFLLPLDLLRRLPNPQQWNESQFAQFASKLQVNSDTLAFALVDAGLLSREQSDLLRRTRVPPAIKDDPELPNDLSPQSRVRREGLLKRGLSPYYVGLCFDALREGKVSASRTAQMLRCSDVELPAIAALFGISAY